MSFFCFLLLFNVLSEEQFNNTPQDSSSLKYNINLSGDGAVFVPYILEEDGYWKLYNEKGAVLEEGKFKYKRYRLFKKFPEKDGMWKYYTDEDGKLYKIVLYDKGKIIDSLYFDPPCP